MDDIKKLLPLLKASDISIQVDDKICTEILKHNIQLNLKNGHYTLQLDDNTFLKQMRKQMLKYTEKSNYQREMYTYFVDIENNKLFFYNGEKIEEFEKNSEVLSEIFISKHKIFKKVSNKSELKTHRAKYMKDASDLYNKTQGKIDLLRFKNEQACLKDLLLTTLEKNNIEFEELDELEDKILYEYYHNGGGGFTYH